MDERAAQVDATVPVARPCGGCTLCCHAIAIHSLDKPCGIDCPHLIAEGCDIYTRRLADEKYKFCNSFQCLWTTGWAEETDRPDRLGVVFTLNADPDHPGKQRMHIFEREPGNIELPRVRQIIQHVLTSGMDITISNTQFFVGVRTDGDAWRYPIDPTDLLKQRVDPAAKPVQILIKGRPPGLLPILAPITAPSSIQV